MADLFGQDDFGVRLDWGPVGARATQADVSVIVDVLAPELVEGSRAPQRATTSPEPAGGSPELGLRPLLTP